MPKVQIWFWQPKTQLHKKCRCVSGHQPKTRPCQKCKSVGGSPRHKFAQSANLLLGMSPKHKLAKSANLCLAAQNAHLPKVPVCFWASAQNTALPKVQPGCWQPEAQICPKCKFVSGQLSLLKKFKILVLRVLCMYVCGRILRVGTIGQHRTSVKDQDSQVWLADRA